MKTRRRALRPGRFIGGALAAGIAIMVATGSTDAAAGPVHSEQAFLVHLAQHESDVVLLANQAAAQSTSADVRGAAEAESSRRRLLVSTLRALTQQQGITLAEEHAYEIAPADRSEHFTCDLLSAPDDVSSLAQTDSARFDDRYRALLAAADNQTQLAAASFTNAHDARVAALARSLVADPTGTTVSQQSS